MVQPTSSTAGSSSADKAPPTSKPANGTVAGASYSSPSAGGSKRQDPEDSRKESDKKKVKKGGVMCEEELREALNAAVLEGHVLADRAFELVELQKDDQSFQDIVTYVNNTKESLTLDIAGAYEIRQGHSQPSTTPTGPSRLVFHGCLSSSVFPILQQGFKINKKFERFDPRFGTGDIFMKATRYSYPRDNSKRWNGVHSKHCVYIFVFQIFYSKAKALEKDNPKLTAPPRGFDCVYAVGKRFVDPAGDKKVGGCVVPLGQIKYRPREKQEGLARYPEYVLYGEDRIVARYLLKINLKPKSAQ